MLDANQNARLKELTELIEKERDHDKSTKLLSELNALELVASPQAFDKPRLLQGDA